ncbi:MAG: ATP synthase subunit I [Anaerocolumna sp.]
MKVNKVVKKETLNIAIGILICSVITQIVFFIFGQFTIAVFWGSLYGGAISLLNFFLMGLTVQNVTKTADEKMAKKQMQFSYSLRQLGVMLLVGAGMYISQTYKVFHWLPILLAIVYPRLIIGFGSRFKSEWKSKGGDIV